MKNGKINTFDSIEGFGNAVIYFITPITLKVMDILTTAKFLQLGVKEGNPLMAWLQSIDLTLAFMISFFMGLSAFAILYYLEDYVSKTTLLTVNWIRFFRSLFKVTYFAMVSVGIYVVIHNLTAISYADTRILV